MCSDLHHYRKSEELLNGAAGYVAPVPHERTEEGSYFGRSTVFESVVSFTAQFKFERHSSVKVRWTKEHATVGAIGPWSRDITYVLIEEKGHFVRL